jgi:dipeptidyl aminopeptidase/acylaminoacyl peptidase
MSFLLAAALVQSIVPRAELPAVTSDPCEPFDKMAPSPSSARPITSSDLVELADIGRSDPNESQSAFGLSPDGSRIAFFVRRANAQANRYCQKLLVRSMDGSGDARELDRGGDFIRDDFKLHGFPSIKAGWPKINAPRWSPDGSQLAYLKRTGQSDQVWVASLDGRQAPRRVSDLPDDVDAVAWLPGGTALVAATRPGIRLQAQAIAEEGRRGFLFDERFAPQFAGRPIPRGELITEYTTIDLQSGEGRSSTAEEIAVLVPPRPGTIPVAARGYAAGPAGYSAWLGRKDPEPLIGATRLVLSNPDGTRLSCDQDLCEGILRMWWSERAGALLAVQKTGWAESQMGILRWDAGQAAPRRLMVTDDVLIGCDLGRDEIVCAREGSAQPRRIVGLDLSSGRERVIHDPNPDFRHVRLGEIRRFRFRNAYGVESFADLVLPPDHRAGEKHPLVVVQYISHGFLRGGSGDEVPIQLLAAKGFAVLSLARPDFTPRAMQAKSERELLTLNRVDWTDRRSVQSSLEAALDLALATGTVDRDRMGISGWSDGASTVQWALINSSLFKAASLGSCCEDTYAYPLASGPAYVQLTREVGYRFFEPGTGTFWRPMSLVLNVDKVEVPMLIQSADSEYEVGLDVVEVYRSENRPIELYVFEDETHYKWQPAHRRAVYERTAEWFDFWLMHRLNCDPDKAEQNRRWLAMAGAPAEDEVHCAPGSQVSQDLAQTSASARSSKR